MKFVARPARDHETRVRDEWIDKFRGASAAVMDRTQGIQSNVWAFAYLICKGAAPCSTLLGGTLALILLGLGGFFLWQQAAR